MTPCFLEEEACYACSTSDNHGTISWGWYITVDPNHHVQLLGEAKILISFAIELLGGDTEQNRDNLCTRCAPEGGI